MKLFFLIIINVLLCNALVWSQNKVSQPARIFITAGQSNTDGRINNRMLPKEIKALSTDTTYETGGYRFCKIVQNDTYGSFVPYWPKGRISSGLWTYDAILYYHLEQAIQQDFYVIKYAVGGTSIAYPKGVAKGRYWSADSEWLKQTTAYENGGNSLLLSLTDAIDAAIDQTCSKLPQGYQFDAFLWHQGESDFKRGAEYYENLKHVIYYVRQHISKKTGNDYSNLPFIFGSIPKTNKNYDPLVQAAMERIAEEDPNAYLIDLSKKDLQGDKLHFTASTASYYGNQAFKILQNIVGLSNHRFRVATYKGDKDCAISYTFDDGLKEHYTAVTPWFNKLGFKGTFWVNGSKVNDDSNRRIDTTRVNWMQLKEMLSQGHEISNHGWAHRNFGRHTLEEIKEDVLKNDSVIFARLGILPSTFCYPNNTKTPEGFAFVRQNRVGTRLMQRSLGGKATTENLNEWIEELIAHKRWGVGMTHGISYGYDQFSDPNIFWKHLQKVKSMEHRIWVGTFKDVAAYIKERKNLTYDIVDQKDGFVIKPHITLDNSLFTQELTGIIDNANVKRLKVHQGKKKLKTKQFMDKTLFDFNPFAGDIHVTIIQKNK